MHKAKAKTINNKQCKRFELLKEDDLVIKA
jgi:hypothetical protein